jgi:[CysO sulfur-carrier protein]-S-L-cysteine hydrolase
MSAIVTQRVNHVKPEMLKIPQSILDMVVTHAREGLPLEVCGILGGTADMVCSMYRISNRKASSTSFLMEPREQIAAMEALRLQGLEVLAFYHSHPGGPACPSDEDIRLAYYPDVTTVIVSLEDPEKPLLSACLISDKDVSYLPLKIIKNL